MSFENDLKRFANVTSENIIKVKRLSAFDLFSAIIVETPVDKGPLRNNWFVGLGQGSTEANPDDTGGNDQIVIDRTETEVNKSEFEDVYFTNNLHYAPAIEFDGRSRKAREGMVRVNTIRWESIVAVNARNLRDGR